MDSYVRMSKSSEQYQTVNKQHAENARKEFEGNTSLTNFEITPDRHRNVS